MKRKLKTCHALVAAGTEAGVSTLKSMLRAAAPPEELVISQATTFPQVADRISPYSGREQVDLLVVTLPFRDGTGIEALLDMTGKQQHLQTILIVRRDIYEQTAYRCRHAMMTVLSMPVPAQVLTGAVRYMMSVCQRLAGNDEEIRQLRKKLSETGYITKAKCLLIQHRGLTEEEAHHYLERQAMDRCVGKKEIALEIINSVQTEGMA